MPYRVLAVLALVALPSCTTRMTMETPDAGPLFDIDAQVVPDAYVPTDAPRPDSGPNLSDVLVYAHSRDTLFTFSPYTNTVSEVGVFTLPGGEAAPYMLDLAVDADGNVFTSSDTALYRVDPETAVATHVGDFGIAGERLYALVFLRAGELRTGETLLGATNEGVYYEVDRNTARTTMVGRYGDGWASSGDLVSIEGLGTFATLRDPDRTDTDFLARITFRTDGSSTVEVLGEVGFRQVFGLGYWGRALYGFTNMGQLLEIDRDSGTGTVVSTETGTMQFWGAGVTTRAPLLI
jgi:hypothetical protein